MRASLLSRGLSFTLVELLVVVSIVIVLLALLMPSLKSARDSVHRISCANNQRQLGQGMNMYASENGDFLPNWVNGDGVYKKLCLAATGKFKGGSKLDKILTCPKNGNGGVTGDYRTPAYFIIFNGTLPGGGGYTSVRITKARTPSKTVYLGESSGNYTSLGSALSSDRIDWINHINKANFLFLDGHVSSVNRRDKDDFIWGL